jgi:hypothetical protein
MPQKNYGGYRRMISEILTYILSGIFSSFITALCLLWLFFKHPEKVEKWISIMTRTIAYFSKKAARTHMMTDIQSTIDAQRKKLNIHEEVLPYGVSVKWTNADEVQTDLKENKVVIMMCPYQSQARNLAHIVSVYVPRALLPKARRYVEPNLMSGIDHTVSKFILKENTTALEYYLSEVMEQANDEVKSWIVKMDKLNEQGILSRILLPEIKRLDILYPQEPNQKVLIESVELASLLHRLATKEPGIDISPHYSGMYIKMAVVPVAKPGKIADEGVGAHLAFIEYALSYGIDHFYVVSTGPLIKYARDLVRIIQQKLKLEKVYEDEHKGLFRGKLTKIFSAMLIVKK